MARQLSACFHAQLAGLLMQEDTGQITYRYDTGWLENRQAVPLSQSLPLRPEPFTEKECRGFFGGILPEGESREIIARNLGITPRNDVKMLEAIGGECAGAITFLPPKDNLPDQEPSYHLLTDAGLATILRELPTRPLLAGKDHVRLSLAGAQNKLAVRIADGQIFLPLDGAPSSHILKPQTERFPGMVVNEWFCLTLARAVGLPTPPVTIGSADGMDYLLVERYDRVPTEDELPRRLHQEDFCQALGIFSQHKYQNEGGPSLGQCFDLLRRASSVPAVDLLSFLDTVVFNYLIGNNDAHGKNFSLLYRGTDQQSWQAVLAPLYDLICTVYYPTLSEKMAMKIGKEYDSTKVQAYHFDRLAEESGLNPRLVRRRIPQLATRVQAALSTVSTPSPIATEIAALIHARCTHTLNLLRS